MANRVYKYGRDKLLGLSRVKLASIYKRLSGNGAENFAMFIDLVDAIFEYADGGYVTVAF